MKRGLVLYIIAASLVVAAAILGIFAYAARESSALSGIEKELSTARTFYERKTSEACAELKKSKDQTEAEDARYVEVDRRIKALEQKIVAQHVKIDGPVEVTTKKQLEREKKSRVRK